MLDTVSIFLALGRHTMLLILVNALSPKWSLIRVEMPFFSSYWLVMIILVLAYNSSKALRDMRRAEYSSTLLINSNKPCFNCFSTPNLTISRPCLAMFSIRVIKIRTIWWLPLATWRVCSSKLNKQRAVFLAKGNLTWGCCLTISAKIDKRKSIYSWFSGFESIVL